MKRVADAVADNEERARMRLRAEGKRGQKHDMQDVLESQAKTKARLEFRRGQKRESTQPLQDLEEEVTSTVPVVSGSAPIQGGSISSTDVPVNSSGAASMSVEDMVQTSVRISTNIGIQPASSGTVGSLCFNESKARHFEKLTDLVLTSNAFPGSLTRESVQGLVRTCLEMCAMGLTEVYSPALFNERSMQLGLSTGVAAELETGWNLQTKSRRDKCISELRIARSKVLRACPPCKDPSKKKSRARWLLRVTLRETRARMARMAL